jgi:hypothetical protein
MGVDYYQCAGCTTGYRDDSDYACYCDCGNNFCHQDCGELDNFTYEYDEGEDKDGEPTGQGNGYAVEKGKPITCVICRHEKYTDYTLLEAVIKHFNITKEIAINIWRIESEKNKKSNPPGSAK